MSDTIQINIEELRRLRARVRGVEEAMTALETSLTSQLEDTLGLVSGESAASLQTAYQVALSAAQDVQHIKTVLASSISGIQSNIDDINSQVGDYAISQIGATLSEIESGLNTVTNQLSVIQFQINDLRIKYQSIIDNYIKITDDTTLTELYSFIHCKKSTSYTLILPPAVDWPGVGITVFNEGGGLLRVEGSGSDTIRTFTYWNVSGGNALIIASDGIDDWPGIVTGV